LKKDRPDLEVRWRAFELRPEPAPNKSPDDDYLKRVWEQSVYPMSERLGVLLRKPPVRPRSRLAHQTALWARREGRFEEMNTALFRAFFEDGRDIGEAEVLGELADTIGLDKGDLTRSLESHDQLDAVLADEATAARYGLTGVPAFVAGGAVLFGVQPRDGLGKLLEFAAQNQDAAPPAGPLAQLPMRLRHF